MGTEVVDSKLAHVTSETGTSENNSLKENEILNQGMVLNEPIMFGSHGMDAPVKGEVNKAPEGNFLEDAVDEWPAPKQIHLVYFVKYRSYEDQKLKDKWDQADKELKKKSQARSQLIEKLRAKRAERSQVISQKVPLGAESKQFRMIVDEKRKEMEPLQQKLGQWRGTMGGGRERGSGLYSSEEELNAHIKSLQYQIQHQSISLNEEKQILRELKQLEGTRPQVIANAAVRAKLLETVGEKEALQDQVKLIGVDLDGVRKDHQVVKAKLKQLDEEQAAIEKEIKSIEDELTAVTQKREKNYESIQELRKQRDEGNSPFYENRTLLMKARELAAKNDVETLRQLSETEVEKFISLWSGSKALRDDYERRILPSLDIRQLSRDGRIRNPDEKPLLLPDRPARAEIEAMTRNNIKQPKEDSVSVSTPEKDAASTQKVQKENNKLQQKETNKQQKETNNKKKESLPEQNDLEDGEETSRLEMPPKDPPKVEVDDAKLKEMRRQEEIAKNRQALERKKKLAEKAALKAAIKAQKEAEKKLKELEKKAKKKSGPYGAAQDSGGRTEPEKLEEKVDEPEETEEKVEAPVPSKNKDRKENVVRYRTRRRGLDSLPRVILERKKTTNYWLWAAPAAIVVLLLLAVGYNYLQYDVIPL